MPEDFLNDHGVSLGFGVGDRGADQFAERGQPLLSAGWQRPRTGCHDHDAGRQTEAGLAARGITMLGPARKAQLARHGEAVLKSLRQLIESVNDTLKGQLDREAHGGRTFEGVAIRVTQRILVMAAAIWHNNKTGQPVTRSLTAYDH
jgi:hypothetical protein